MKKLLPYLPQFCRWSALLFLLAVLASPAMAQVKPETASTGKIEPTAVNANHELVLCRDGSVKGWGDNSYSQLGFNPGQVATPANIIIPSATDIVRVALTTNGASFAVRASGQLLAWGNNANGLLGLGPNVTQNSIPAVVPLPSPVISIAGGSLSVAALCADGTVWTWGDNRFGGLGDNSPTTTTRYIPAQIPSSLLANVRTIAAGEEFSLALTANGQMFSWGNDFAGCLGIGILSQSINRIQRSPALLNLANVRQIDASYSRAIALRTDGTVWAWGRNSASQLGISNSNYTSTPTQVAAGIITDARWVSMNLDGHIAVRPTGATYVWGFNAGGCFASPTPAISTVPIAGPTLSPGVQIIGRITHFMSLETNGIVKTWGGDNLGYTPIAPGPLGQSYVPTSPTGVCLAVPTASFPLCGPQRAYYQQGTANYQAVLHNCWESPAEIGTYGQLTTIDISQPPYNGSLTFDGIYHVRGNVRFANGNVTLAPGTVFYLDGPNGNVVSSSDDSRLVSLEVRDATLTMSGATLQASCSSLWAGVVVSTGGRVVTTPSGSGQRPLIRDAEFAVSNSGGTLRLDQTDFLNNAICLREWIQATSASENISYCSFRVNQFAGGPLAASSYGLYNTYGIYFMGNGSSPNSLGNFTNSVYSNNTFEQLKYGVYGLGDNALIRNNKFNNCWGAALEGFTYFEVYPGAVPPVRFYDNQVKLPRNFPVAFTNAPNLPVYGVHAQNNVDVRGNIFFLAPATTGVVSRRIGVSLSNGGTVTGTNTFDFLDVGIQANGAHWSVPISYDFSGNDFYGNAEGISFQPPGPNSIGQGINVAMRCNTFNTGASANTSTATGVWVKINSEFASNLGTINNPNGNRFDGVVNPTKRFVHDGVRATSFAYFRFNSSQEQFSGSVPTPGNIICNSFGAQAAVASVSSVPAANACGINAPTGVDARPASPLLPAALLQLRQDSLARHVLTATRQPQLLASVLNHHRYARSYAALETYLRPLATARPAVYIPGALLLLHAYRQAGHEADAQRVRPTLDALAATDAELLNYLRYWDAVGHLRPDRHLPIGYDLPAADLAALRLSAASGTLAARPACELLQRLDTNCRCVLPDDLAPAVQALTAQRAATAATALLGEAHPNPASSSVTLDYALPAGSAPATLVLRDLTGRLVLTQALEGAAGVAVLAVAGLPGGLYLATLERNGHRYASRKLAVVH